MNPHEWVIEFYWPTNAQTKKESLKIKLILTLGHLDFRTGARIFLERKCSRFRFCLIKPGVSELSKVSTNLVLLTTCNNTKG